MKKKRIGIITLYYRNYNYGGLLQAYALANVLNKQLKQNAEQISYIPAVRKTSMAEKWDLVKGFSLGSLAGKAVIKFDILLRTVTKPKLTDKFTERKKRCDAFREKVPHTIEVRNEELEKLNENFDIFITGSDQVWNPNMFRSAYFLDFVKDGKRKVAYAASMAVNNLSAQQRKKLVPLIDRFEFVSMREKKAVDILTECIPNKKIEAVVDPVLLLTEEEWSEIANPPLEGQKYAYAYFLGERKRNIRLAKALARMSQLPIATVPYIYRRYNGFDHDFGDIELYDAGPDEFVGLIKDAEVVMTDSFHAAVFSIIFKKPFWVFDRDNEKDVNSMNSRLTVLLEELGLSDRRITAKEQLNENIIKKPIDYDKVYSILEGKRKYSLDFLEKAVNWEMEKV